MLINYSVRIVPYVTTLPSLILESAEASNNRKKISPDAELETNNNGLLQDVNVFQNNFKIKISIKVVTSGLSGVLLMTKTF